MKKEIIGVLVFVLLLVAILSQAKNLDLTMRGETSEKAEESYVTSNKHDIPMGFGVWTIDNVDFFNKYAKDQDVIGVWPVTIDLLDYVHVGKKAFVFFDTENLSNRVIQAKEAGAEIIVYNLEADISKEELISKEKEVYQLAKENEMIFIFIPRLIVLEQHYKDFVQHTDVIGIQTQNYMTLENYEEIVEDRIDKIREANPYVEVLIQVSVNPPNNRYITAGKVIDHINVIKDKADEIDIWYDQSRPDRVSVMEKVFKNFRTDNKKQQSEVGQNLDFDYVMGNPIHADKIQQENIDKIKDEFQVIKELGTDLAIQVFLSDSTEEDWDMYFDAAYDEGIKIIPWFRGDTITWNGSGFDLGVNQEFLEHMKDHPALYAFFLIDEPFEKINTVQLQMLYQQAKQIAPNVLMLVQFSREIMKAEEAGNPDYRFESGMCDICQISALEFRNYGDGKKFYKDVLLKNHNISRRVIQREDPDVKIWSSVQVFGSEGSTYYMPTPAELKEMIHILLSPELEEVGELNGMVFQRWKTPTSDQEPFGYSLSDEEFEDLRDIVTDTWEKITEGKPFILIEKPRIGYLYILNQKILPLSPDKSLIIGKITVETDAYDNEGIGRVEFYIDDVLYHSDYDIPYEWTWDEFAMGGHEIKVIAYDVKGNITIDDIMVRKFL